MFEIHVTIACPDLLAAAKLLVRHTTPESAGTSFDATTKSPESAGTSFDATTKSPANMTGAPVPSLSMPAASTSAAPSAPMPAANTPVTPSTPASTPAPVVPLSQGPVYTVAQIAKAGADLISQNPGLLPQVNALLAQYGVQAVTDVKPEHYGAFATALRGMGAKI